MQRRGFSLVELLIVLVIVALLGSLLTVAVHQARERARSAQCLNNLRQLSLGFRLYADAKGGRFPKSSGTPWFMQLAPILESQAGVFRCPSDPQGLELSYNWRDEAVVLPHASLAGQRIDRVANSELALVFDQATGWHAPAMVNAALISGAAIEMDEEAFEQNLLLDTTGGALFNGEMP